MPAVPIRTLAVVLFCACLAAPRNHVYGFITSVPTLYWPGGMYTPPPLPTPAVPPTALIAFWIWTVVSAVPVGSALKSWTTFTSIPARPAGPTGPRGALLTVNGCHCRGGHRTNVPPNVPRAPQGA